MSRLRNRVPLPAAPRSADVVRTREALEEMVATDGWRIFHTYVTREWEGVGYKARMRAALAKDDIEPKVIDRVSDELLRLLQWPTDTLAELGEV